MRHVQVVVRVSHVARFQSLCDGFGVVEVASGCEYRVGKARGVDAHHFGRIHVLEGSFDGVAQRLFLLSFCVSGVVRSLAFVFDD